MKRLPLCAGLAATCLLAPGAWAAGFDITDLQSLNQGQFRQLSQDLGAALSYKPLAPAEALGITGFDIGVALTGTTLDNKASVQSAIGNSTIYSTLPVPTLRVIKGLPYNVDVGAMYARIPSSGINLYGADVKWAVLPGGIALPAVALRGSVTRVDGISQLGFETYGLDVSVSQDFVVATPYAGVGLVWSRSATDGLALAQENLTQQKLFGGVDFNLGLTNLVFEVDSTGGIHSYSAKLGFRF
jgi:hypothetical protein